MLLLYMVDMACTIVKSKSLIYPKLTYSQSFDLDVNSSFKSSFYSERVEEYNSFAISTLAPKHAQL